jgi:hypothetical protein
VTSSEVIPRDVLHHWKRNQDQDIIGLSVTLQAASNKVDTPKLSIPSTTRRSYAINSNEQRIWIFP